ncbi:MAG: hypothetical protein NC177_14800 [Ruminococcus flavefaciens]|nr:hypothetical protein [Ruminococcus flavefaciens]
MWINYEKALKYSRNFTQVAEQDSDGTNHEYEADTLNFAKCAEAAINKQIPQKIKEIHIDEYYCPACGTENNCNDKIVEDCYCPVCGQRIYQEDLNNE